MYKVKIKSNKNKNSHVTHVCRGKKGEGEQRIKRKNGKKERWEREQQGKIIGEHEKMG
jgi:hypothetical protein